MYRSPPDLHQHWYSFFKISAFNFAMNADDPVLIFRRPFYGFFHLRRYHFQRKWKWESVFLVPHQVG